MSSKRFFSLSAIICMAMSQAALSDVTVRPGGFAYYQVGQIMHVTPASQSSIDKPWDQHVNLRLTLDALINDNLRVILGAEGELGANINDNQKKKIFLDAKEAQGIYSFGNRDVSPLSITLGYFPFKYNPQATNLGEYLFRSGTYPGFIITDFDNAKIRLMGLKVSSRLMGGNFKQDLLFTSEYNVIPMLDYSLSYLAGYTLPSGLLSMGGGVSFDRLIAIEPDKTTDPGAVVYDKNNLPVIEGGDTLHYTMKGIKLMANAAFDPKPVLPFRDIMGPNDGKIYGEVAVLGLKNYGVYYPKLARRIPVMFGMNIPTFKVLDLLSLEFEYFASDPKYKLDIPTSGKATPELMPVDVKKSPWKWSVFAEKTIVKGFAIKGLVGRDHFRGLDAGGNYEVIEAMNGTSDWHYKIRAIFSF